MVVRFSFGRVYNGPNYPVTVSMTFETLSTMAGAGAIPFVDNKIAQRRVILFTKSFCPDSKTARKFLDEFNLGHDIYEVVEIEKRQDCSQIENYFQILCLSDTREVRKN